ncbi:MAG: hypothetical protein K6U87_07140 [Firmicutes bacterium]|nr:hypothetical protein [Bacillota bacterium]
MSPSVVVGRPATSAVARWAKSWGWRGGTRRVGRGDGPSALAGQGSGAVHGGQRGFGRGM